MSDNSDRNQEDSQAPPPRGLEALKHHVITHIIDVALWATRIVTLVFAFCYFIPLFG